MTRPVVPERGQDEGNWRESVKRDIEDAAGAASVCDSPEKMEALVDRLLRLASTIGAGAARGLDDTEVERAAKALCELEEQEEWDADSHSRRRPGEVKPASSFEQWREEYERKARVVLAAARSHVGAGSAQEEPKG